jgi:hypothetical protein
MADRTRNGLSQEKFACSDHVEHTPEEKNYYVFKM